VTFKEQCEELCKADPGLQKQLGTALDKIAADPACGKPLRRAPQRIQGKVYRLHVGGRKGHRLFYLYIQARPCVIPYYLSEQRRSKFDYDDVEWGEIAEAFYDDFTNKRYEEFLNYRP
jgi:hypothetical protein